jgi:hypothetical protein
MSHISRKSQGFPQFLSIGGRVVAELTATGILDRHTWVTLRKPEASIGYDVSLLHDAQKHGAITARNRNQSSGIAYITPITRIWELGFRRDFGWGEQIFLPLRLWDVHDKDGRIVPAIINEQPATVQLPLFSEGL